MTDVQNCEISGFDGEVDVRMDISHSGGLHFVYLVDKVSDPRHFRHLDTPRRRGGTGSFPAGQQR